MAKLDVVVHEVLLDKKTLVAEADDEFIKSLGLENLHQMPQDRFLADFDHRFGLKVGFFGNAGSQPPGKDNDFHCTLPHYVHGSGNEKIVGILFENRTPIMKQYMCLY